MTQSRPNQPLHRDRGRILVSRGSCVLQRPRRVKFVVGRLEDLIVPNGHAEERDVVWERSRLWGTIWQIGDAAYYVGLLSSVIVPLAILGDAILHFDTWLGLLKALGLAALFLLACFPLGLGICMVLKQWARRSTGV